MKAQQRTAYNKTALKVFIGLFLSFILIQIYWLSRPTYDAWQCFWNPVGCASQTVIDGFVSMIGLFINLLTVIAVGIAWLILKLVESRH